MTDEKACGIDEAAPLRALMERALAGSLPVPRFCDQFEHVYNFEVDRERLPPSDAESLRQLFDKVVWYSPFPSEREVMPSYLGDTEILAAIELAVRTLEGGSADQ